MGGSGLVSFGLVEGGWLRKEGEGSVIESLGLLERGLPRRGKV